ncbi:tryptophan 2,3-dioxygenase [Amycolatopsis bartoniae]|uniref:Tryptophan 2,3-dioxygenase n=1 Tax=Amycolatopsis bartoniae TaxID=941986 RepID=A0A8H9M9F8_9PSEU|nr:tryptophan 2,3-dioxygenase family protein [Amycolatopsis bartoniae]MBB2934253.1 tryptophan 2,3-dioxygenase [Amycolatopsis bartoniae]TVT08458.1 tryptophan 2,3-dioxygenase [Amycolatopsis bartoniae]GHF48757.1 tryptophan 2,3-dioxygenase [Amycolatopsis bartoniae]
MPDDAALTYTSYLALQEVLAAQRPRSDEHDEMLFIVIHQVYELWFKQLLHEVRYLQQRLEAGDTARAVRTLRRILTILKVVVAQIDVLETMTPSQFASFRARLDAASGFQSAQFRELEAVLGRRDERAFEHYAADDLGRQRIIEAMARPSLWESFQSYLKAHGYEGDLPRVYADDEGPALVAEHLVDLDEGLQEWRYRHVKMVERTIGDKAGTGGSSGAEYLRATLFRPVFPELWAIRRDL